MMIRPPKWVVVTTSIALGSLLLTLLLGWSVQQQREREERDDCERMVAVREDNRSMWLYVLEVTDPKSSPEQAERIAAFTSELDKRLPSLTCVNGNFIPKVN